MRTALLSLVAAVALAATAGSADARPPRYYNNYYNPSPVIVYPSINTSPYAYPNYVYPAGGYYNYGSGYNLNVGGFGYNTYPYGYSSGYYNYNNYSPYYYNGLRW